MQSVHHEFLMYNVKKVKGFNSCVQFLLQKNFFNGTILSSKFFNQKIACFNLFIKLLSKISQIFKFLYGIFFLILVKKALQSQKNSFTAAATSLVNFFLGIRDS